jgi:hypothetical protein
MEDEGADGSLRKCSNDARMPVIIDEVPAEKKPDSPRCIETNEITAKTTAYPSPRKKPIWTGVI